MLIPALALLASASCTADVQQAAAPATAAPACAPRGASWRQAATEGDRDRMRDWRSTWDEALTQARTAGHGGEIAGEGALLEPDSALTRPDPPPGDYDCRTIKLGSQFEGGLAYVAYPAFRCRIRADNGVLTFTKLTGSQRPIGRLYGDMDRRMVFLGAIQLGDERRAYRYGTDRERDMIGLLERIGERRWRLVFPSPRFESTLDVIELVPR